MNKKISDLALASALAGTEQFEVLQGGVNKRVPASSIISTTSFVDGETPTGTIDGVNAAFTLANTPVTGSVHLYMPFRLKKDLDYTISGANITMITIPQVGDTFLADYRK